MSSKPKGNTAKGNNNTKNSSKDTIKAPTYTAKIVSASNNKVEYYVVTSQGVMTSYGIQRFAGSEDQFRKSYNEKVYPPRKKTNTKTKNQEEPTPPETVTEVPNPLPPEDPNDLPLDPRLVFLVDDESGEFIYSFTSKPSLQAPLVDGMVMKNENGDWVNATDNKDFPRKEADKYVEFFGVPAIMNYNAYINVAGAGGKSGNKNLIERENQPRWYEHTSGLSANNPDGTTSGLLGELTVKNLVEWSKLPYNTKFPYRYNDFVYLKWWKKIPLNYMITLRRFTRPTTDNMGSAEEVKGEVDKKSLLPAATAITFLGEEAGNKLSSLLGPIGAKLKWKDIKSEVWTVSTGGGGGGSPQSPMPGIAKALGFLTTGKVSKPGGGGGGSPPDPYNGGPYANKMIGPVTVIDSTKARDRGIEFSHTISLTFEYSARSIGGINSKAALLDIFANLMILTFNEAAFWGGMNRFVPQGGGGSADPFLGGPAGRKAWMQGDPGAFFKAVGDQFAKALENIGDAFSQIMADPINGAKALLEKGASTYMKSKGGSGGGGNAKNIHALLTGAPVGEWHLTVGNPMNPMMMIGNLICTGVTLNFNDELGPDDFPTELKAVITLEHGMPRDRSAIESMFNAGSGRLYSMPKGYEGSFSSTNQTAVDAATGAPAGKQPVGASGDAKNETKYPKNGQGGKSKSSYSNNPLLGDPKVIDGMIGYFKQSFLPRIQSVGNAVYSHGVKPKN